MSISTAITRAYEVMHLRNWDTIYWAVDLHGVCMKSNYEEGVHEFISQDAVDTLRLISSLPESKIILWSSAYDDQKPAIIEAFAREKIEIFDFNQNLEAADTKTGCFQEKFYFSILLDDKAGFEPETDWAVVHATMIRMILENKTLYNKEAA